jgi:hypothetical protein
MSYFTYGKDILDDVLFRASESTLSTGDISDYRTACKMYIMRAYHYILTYYPFPFALKSPPGIINTVDDQEIQVNVTEGSTGVVLQALANGSLLNFRMYIEGDDIRYRVVAHSGGTLNVTLDATWKGDTGSGEGIFYKDEYTLATDCLKPWAFKLRDNPETMFIFESPREMFGRQPILEIESSKYRISLVRGNDIQIHPHFDMASSIEYEYTRLIDDLDFAGTGAADTLIIPRPFAPVLSDVALYMLQTDKNDPRIQISEKDVSRGMTNMVNWYGGLSKPRVRPRISDAIGRVRR